MTNFFTAVGLGLGAGINSYATLLVFGLLARWKPTMFPSELATFFSSTPVLIVIGVLYCVEFFADKVPAIDHAWDVIHTFIRPAAGALVGWAATSQDVPKGVVILASIVAGGAALTTHTAKASLRAASTATTGGLANPVLSIVEDIFAFLNAILAILLPWIVVVVIVLVTIFFIRLSNRYRKRDAF
ncbi:MAG TPA: DUF4126 domain-containing protein [Thermoanaerobaculia bacterium]|jgi:hypothetical protein|nr:DUF4126 domain-containing protein [Thermoanaerobaculia bacterium]